MAATKKKSPAKVMKSASKIKKSVKAASAKASSNSLAKKAKKVLKSVVKGAVSGALKGAMEAGSKETGLGQQTMGSNSTAKSGQTNMTASPKKIAAKKRSAKK